MDVPKLDQLRAVIFDFDGVMVDSEWEKYRSLQRALRPHGIRLPDNHYQQKVGLKVSAFLKLRYGRKLSDAQISEISDARRCEQAQNLRKYAKLIPGIRAFVEFLQKRGIKLCIATGSRRPIVKRMLQMVKLHGPFTLITGEDYRSSKPNPEVYLLAKRRLKLPAAQLLVIEDAPAGIVAAKRAGLPTVGIATTFSRGKLKRADLVVRNFRELRQKLR